MEVKTALVNVSLRVATLGSRFMLLLYIGRIHGMEIVGQYGLFVSLCSLGIYVAGLDFYSFSLREIVGRPKDEWGRNLRVQMSIYAPMYVAIFVAAKSFGSLPPGVPHVDLWFLLVLVSEHLTQEIYRILEVTGRASFTCIYLFIRSGLWVFVYMALDFGGLLAGGQVSIYACWCAGNAMAVLFALVELRKMNWFVSGSWLPDRAYLKRGLYIGLTFFVGTVAMRSISALDKLILTKNVDIQLVGLYVLCFNIANGMQDFIFTGVFMRKYPTMLAAWASRNYSLFDDIREKLLRAAILASVALMLFCVPLLLVAEWLLTGPAHSEGVPLILVLGLSTCAVIIGRVYYYKIYAQNCNLRILVAAVLALFVAFLFLCLLVPPFGVLGAATAVFLSNVAAATVYSWRSEPRLPAEA